MYILLGISQVVVAKIKIFLHTKPSRNQLVKNEPLKPHYFELFFSSIRSYHTDESISEFVFAILTSFDMYISISQGCV